MLGTYIDVYTWKESKMKAQAKKATSKKHKNKFYKFILLNSYYQELI